MVLGCVFLGLTGVSVASATYWYQRNLNASDFKPVRLSQHEQTDLDQKVSALSGETEDPAKTITLNEREINAYLHQQGYGERLKLNLGSDKVSATMITPVDPSVPVIGGRTLRLNVVFNAIQSPEKKISFSLADVNLGGISLPNAWLGGIKGVDLFKDVESSESSLMKTISAGIKEFKMQPGEIKIFLNE